MKINKIIAFVSAVQLMAAGSAICTSALTTNASVAPEISAASQKLASDTATFNIDKSVNGDQVILTVTAAKGASLNLAGYSFTLTGMDGLSYVSAEAGSKFSGKTEFGANSNEFAFRNGGGAGVTLADGDVIVKITLKGNTNADPGIIKLEAVDTNGTIITDKITLNGNEPFMLGDVNLDGKVDASDATDILKAYSDLSTGGNSGLNSTQKKAAEVIADGKLDASDATKVLQYYSYLSTGGKSSLPDFLKEA